MKPLVMIALACLLSGCAGSFRSADIASATVPPPKVVDINKLPRDCPALSPAPRADKAMTPAEIEAAWKTDRAAAILCRARLLAYSTTVRDHNRLLRGEISR